jgi:hypothetical protein
VVLQRIYLVFSKLLSWMVLRTRSDTTRDFEILVLRHQLAVLPTAHSSTRMVGSGAGAVAAAGW